MLPLIERELRVRARSRAVYWTRFAVALAGILLCLRTLNLAAGPSGASPGLLGLWAFRATITAAFILCCGAGFLTVDGISRQRREGTLGLLCLTRVRALDVLLGSFGAAGITCLCALMAFVPFIMLPVLAGGVTGGEAFRTMLALFDTLVLSLAAGLWASAGARGWFQSARSAMVLLLLLIVAPTVALMFPMPVTSVYGVSPLAAFYWADAAVYRASAASYWLSLAAVHGISWCLLFAAGFRLRRAMRQADGPAENVGASGRTTAVTRKTKVDMDDPAARPVFTLAAWKIGFPDKAMADDPVRWLVRRQRGLKAVVWTGVLVSVIPYAANLLIALGSRAASTLISFYSWPVSVAVGVVQGCLFGWAASRFLVEARRTGELELLLTSPVGAKTIVSSQWNQLKRVFFVPVILLAAPNLLLTLYYTTFAHYHQPPYAGTLSYRLYFALTPFLGFIRTILGIGALIWAGLWFGLKARSQAGVILQIILFARGVPFVILFGASSLLRLLVNHAGAYGAGGVRFPWEYWLYVLNPVAGCFYYLWLIRWARRRLAAELAHPSQEGFDLSDSIAQARAGLASLFDKARNWPPAPKQ
jgi:uncharacterized membrane protein (UPF0136 family)